SASDRARAARLLAWASCLSRLLREVITDISDIAKKPLSRMRAKTISSSATRAYPAACMGGLLDGPGRQGAAEVGAGVVVHRLRPRAPREDSRGAAAATRVNVAPRQYRAPARAVIILRIAARPEAEDSLRCSHSRPFSAPASSSSRFWTKRPSRPTTAPRPCTR